MKKIILGIIIFVLVGNLSFADNSTSFDIKCKEKILIKDTSKYSNLKFNSSSIGNDIFTYEKEGKRYALFNNKEYLIPEHFSIYGSSNNKIMILLNNRFIKIINKYSEKEYELIGKIEKNGLGKEFFYEKKNEQINIVYF